MQDIHTFRYIIVDNGIISTRDNIHSYLIKDNSRVQTKQAAESKKKKKKKKKTDRGSKNVRKKAKFASFSHPGLCRLRFAFS